MDRKTKALLKSEAGNTLIANMVGSLTMIVVAGAIAVGIVGLLNFQLAIKDRTAVTKEISLADSVFRSDVLAASAISAVDQHRVELTSPGRNGLCKVSTWAVEPVGGKTAVTATVVSYPGMDTSVNPVRCSGTGSAPTIQILVADAGAAAGLTYANAAGRSMTFAAGASTLDSAAAPSGTDTRLWNSTEAGAVTLETQVASSTPRAAGYRISQTADNLSVAKQGTDTASYFVPEGNLTAVPAG